MNQNFTFVLVCMHTKILFTTDFLQYAHLRDSQTFL